jgi:hypothetical protein
MNAVTQTSALDIPVTLTRFLSHTANVKQEDSISLRSLARHIVTMRRATKAELHWLKLASFGDQPTDSGSLRHNANMLSVSGVEGDYDAGDMTPETGAEMLRQAGIAALIYTSPSHQTTDPETGEYKGERWRVLCPCLVSHQPKNREGLLARVNGALGGVLAGESFTASQAYYYGAAGENPAPQTILVEGRPLDMAIDLDDTAIGRPGGATLPKVQLPQGIEPDDTARAALQAACAMFKHPKEGQQNHDIVLAATNTVAPFVKSGHLARATCIAEIEEAMTKCEGGREPKFATEVSDALDGAVKFARDYAPPSDGSEFAADPLEDQPEMVKAKAKFQWLDVDDVEAMADPTWLVEDVLPSQGVATTFGPPKEGKTFTKLSMALHIAAGKPWFGRKVDQGAVYYIAGEGAGGLKLRIKAARAHYGIARGVPFHVLTRAAKFTDPGEVRELIASIQDKHRMSGVPVRMIVVDTLARAMPGAEENGARDMGLVVEQCDRLREAFACLVMLVHHTGKDIARGMRGSNSLDGAVDCAIRVTREKSGTSDVVTVENTYQKESREFAPLFFDLVTVPDPDGGRGSLALTARVEAPVKAKPGNPRQEAVLRIVREMTAEQPDGAKLGKQAVIERCAADPLVTTAGRPNDRRRTAADYLSALVEAGLVATSGEHVWLTEPAVSLTELLTCNEP